MAWITASNIVTTNLDTDGKSPLNARPNLKAALDEIIVAANGRGQADGVASLDSNTLVPAAQLPDTLISSGSNNLVLDPGSSKVAIQDVVNLNPRTVAQLNALTSVLGDVAFCSNGAAGADCLAFYDGSAWKRCDDLTTISA